MNVHSMHCAWRCGHLVTRSVQFMLLGDRTLTRLTKLHVVTTLLSACFSRTTTSHKSRRFTLNILARWCPFFGNLSRTLGGQSTGSWLTVHRPTGHAQPAVGFVHYAATHNTYLHWPAEWPLTTPTHRQRVTHHASVLVRRNPRDKLLTKYKNSI